MQFCVDIFGFASNGGGKGAFCSALKLQLLTMGNILATLLVDEIL